MNLYKSNHHRHKHSSYGIKSIDFYACQSSLKFWNSSYKLLSACFILILCILLDCVWVSIAVIVTTGLVNLLVNKVSAGDYIDFLKIPIAFLMLGCIVIVFGISKNPVGDYNIFLFGGYLYFTKTSIGQALALFFKVMGAVSVMYLLALSTPVGEVIMVLKKAHVPDVVVELMNMIYRFIFILAEVHANMKIAVMARLGYIDFKTSCFSFGQIGGNLFILSLQKANTYYDAMVSRGYEGNFPFWEEQKSVKIWQIGIVAAYTGSLLVLYILVK